MKSFISGFSLTFTLFLIIFFYTNSFYKSTKSIFFVNSNYNTYLFDDNEMILPTKYKYVKLENVPEELIYYLIWSEDRNFFEHFGVNPKSILRAFYINVKEKNFAQGGSTLTQQLAKTVYLSHEKTFKRKLLDMMLAFFIERSYSKDEILEGYINSVYQGNDISGFGASAMRYFRKDIFELNTEEMLLLVGIINGPELYNPYKYPDRAKKQAKKLLYSIEDNPFIKDKSKAERSIDEMTIYPLDYKKGYLNFIYQAKSEESRIGLKGGGYTIKTTFNKDVYESVTLNASTSSIVINNKNGKILSFWGSQYSNFMSLKQIGSNIKPFYYLLALEKGYTPDTVLPDKPINFGNWSPQNFDKKFRGEVKLKDALIHSLNVPSIYLATHIGNSPTDSITQIKEFLINKIGLKGKYTSDLTLALGTLESNPYNMVRAFCIFPNYGIIPKIYSISEIYDRKGNLIYKKYPEIEKRVSISNETYSTMNQLLRGVVETGSGKKADVDGIDIHGKTGTAEYATWFTGFTGSKGVSVRVDGKGLLSTTSSVPVASRIIKNFIYIGNNFEVPLYINVKNVFQKTDFFDDPITFITKGFDVIQYLKYAKLKFNIKDLKIKISKVISQIEDLYPDVAKKLNEWKEKNLVDFLNNPFVFIQNGYDVDDYLSNLLLDKGTKSKLIKVKSQLEDLYPDIASKIDSFLKSQGE